MKIEAKRYRWKERTRFAQERAVPSGEALDELRERHSGKLTAPLVVEAARPEESELHWAFEWDDSVAAEQHRRTQARELMRALVVVYEDPLLHEERETRVFHVVDVEPVEPEAERDGESAVDGVAGVERGYYHVTDVMTDPVMRGSVLATARRELAAWRRKYQELNELANVFAAIDSMAAE